MNKDFAELVAKAQNGDEKALEKCYLDNKLLIISLLNRFHYQSSDRDDLMQVASIGLIKAVQNFDASYGVEFSTYAVPLILGEIRRFFRESGTLKVARSIKELSSKLIAIEEEYLQVHGEKPSVAYLAGRLEVSEEEVAVALESRAPVQSLEDQIMGDETMTLSDTMGKEDRATMAEYLDLHMAMEQLPPKEQLFVHLRYYEGLTQSEIAERLFTSQVQISRLEKSVLAKMRAILTKV